MCDCTCTSCLGCDADFEDAAADFMRARVRKAGWDDEPPADGFMFGSPEFAEALSRALGGAILAFRELQGPTPPELIPAAFRRSSTPLIDPRRIIDYADESIRA